MFYLNVGYRWTIQTAVSQVHAVVYLPSHNSIQPFLRKELPASAQRLFDPQLYLSGLDAARCVKACSRLATFPWFRVPNVPEFDSGETSVQKWEADVRGAIAETWSEKPGVTEDIQAACREAIEFQLNLGCTQVILPAPLIAEANDDGTLATEWIDRGIAAAQEAEAGQPLLASVVILDTLLVDSAFEPAGLVDGIVDQMTAIEGVDGVYIAVAQSRERHPFAVESSVYFGYAELVRRFRAAGVGIILTNFADAFGIAAVGLGAEGFATGNSQALRRLALPAFEERDGGPGFPHFYSHKTASELLTETDLDRIVQRHLVGRIEDRTEFSEDLMDVLEAGGSASSLPLWAENKSNLATAHKHFVSRMAREGSDLSDMGLTERRDAARTWLEDAAANSQFVIHRLQNHGMELEAEIAPTEKWLEIFDGAN